MFNIFTSHHGTSAGHYLTEAARFFQALVFPHQCLGCRSLMGPDPEAPDLGDGMDAVPACFCRACAAMGLPRFEPPYCPFCGHLRDSGDNHVCETCLKKRPRIRKVRAALAYQGLVPQIVPLFKYQARLSLARFFEPLMYEALERHFGKTGIHLVVPVPLHPRKLRQRGFNQSFILARGFERMYHQAHGTRPLWQMDPFCIKRARYTRPQTGLDIAVRKKNLKNAFQVTDPARVKGAHILLVDDVFTTGATCSEAAKALLKAGAGRVDVLVLARA
jgi:ComF family protein